MSLALCQFLPHSRLWGLLFLVRYTMIYRFHDGPVCEKRGTRPDLDTIPNSKFHTPVGPNSKSPVAIGLYYCTRTCMRADVRTLS